MKLRFGVKCFIAMLCIISFFYNIIGNGYLLLTASLLPVADKLLMCFISKTKFSRYWLVYLVFIIISIGFSFTPMASVKFLYLMILYLLIKTILENETGWQRMFAKWVYILCFVNVIATIMSIIVPDFILYIAENLYSGEILTIYKMLFDLGSYSGICAQTAINAFFISIFIAFIVSNLLNSTKKFSSYLLIALGVIALMLTRKRSFVIANLAAILVLFWRNSASDKQKSRKILSMVALGTVIFIALRFHPSTEAFMEKITALEEIGDTSNGRYEYWNFTIMLWKLSPIFGFGGGSLVSSFGLSTHNVYLQILAELGIFGAISFVALVLSTLIHSFNKYSAILQNNYIEKKDKAICGVSIYVQVLFVVYSFFGNPLYGIHFMLPYVIFIALIEAYNKLGIKKMQTAIQSGDDQNEDRNIDIP